MNGQRAVVAGRTTWGTLSTGALHFSSANAVDTVIFDVDGTLVDTNYLHTVAWSRAFSDQDMVVPMWRIHRAIGMGGDKLVEHLTDGETDRWLGDSLRRSWDHHYTCMLDQVHALPHARDLLTALSDRGIKVALASSGKPEHLERAMTVLDARSAITAVVDAGDAESKPEPDLFTRALEVVGGTVAGVVGDSVWDAAAAGSAGLPMIGLLTGGFSRAELVDAGAEQVLDDPLRLLRSWFDNAGHRKRPIA